MDVRTDMDLAEISIHAPVKGATCMLMTAKSRTADFNPRTREGCDFDLPELAADVEEISIHAPVKGATRLRGSWAASISLFQSTHP